MKYSDNTFTILDHTADIGLKAYGSSLTSLFEETASAFVSLLLAEYPKTEFQHTTKLEITGEDYVDLMVRLLSEILYLFETKLLITNNIEIKSVTYKKLATVLKMTEFNPDKHKIINNIKAVTYHNAIVNKTDDGWYSIIYFDI